MSVADWVCYLPAVHPFFVDMAQTRDRTVARLACRRGSLHAQVGQLEGALAAECSPPDKRLQRTKLAAYREQIADYQVAIALCRSQFEAQVARRWTGAEIARAKNRASGPSGELVESA